MKIPKKYQALIDRWPLRPIANDDDLDLATEVADDLCMRERGKDEEDYLHVLTMLIEDYEIKAGHVPDEVVTPLEMLKFLMDENDLKQMDLIKILGISSGNASEIMSGKRELSKAHIPVIAARFGVNPSVFLPPVKLPPDEDDAPTYAGKKWGIGSTEKGVYLPADGTRVVREKHKTTKESKGEQPKGASAKTKKKTKGY